MLRGKWNLWVAATAVTAFLAGGCCQEERNQIQTLQRENSDLKTAREALRTQLSAAQQAESDAVNRAGALTSEIANRDAEIAGLQARLADANARRTAGAPGWEQGLMGDKIVVGVDLLFDSGRATLTVAGRGRLDRIAQDIKTHYPGKPIRVFGHTDTDPIDKTKHLWTDNLDLSANRAMTVARYLKDKGISPSLIETVAMGQYHPQGADKSKNRRVEVYVVKAK